MRCFHLNGLHAGRAPPVRSQGTERRRGPLSVSPFFFHLAKPLGSQQGLTDCILSSFPRRTKIQVSFLRMGIGNREEHPPPLKTQGDPSQQGDLVHKPANDARPSAGPRSRSPGAKAAASADGGSSADQKAQRDPGSGGAPGPEVPAEPDNRVLAASAPRLPRVQVDTHSCWAFAPNQPVLLCTKETHGPLHPLMPLHETGIKTIPLLAGGTGRQGGRIPTGYFPAWDTRTLDPAPNQAAAPTSASCCFHACRTVRPGARLLALLLPQRSRCSF